MGCEDGQEMRLVEIGRMVDNRARDIQSKIGVLPESSLLATLCIVLADEIMSKDKADTATMEEILKRIQEIKNKME